MLVGLPSFYGAWFKYICGVSQHAGLAEDVLDHRLNSRTIMMNPVFRFIYWNMNYHVEHHMFPMVPYHALPKLHEEMKHELPVVYPSLWAAYKEIIPTLLKQRKDPSYFIRRELPATATPLAAE
jgi:fatty acid desaturase